MRRRRSRARPRTAQPGGPLLRRCPPNSASAMVTSSLFGRDRCRNSAHDRGAHARIDVGMEVIHDRLRPPPPYPGDRDALPGTPELRAPVGSLWGDCRSTPTCRWPVEFTSSSVSALRAVAVVEANVARPVAEIRVGRDVGDREGRTAEAARTAVRVDAAGTPGATDVRAVPEGPAVARNMARAVDVAEAFVVGAFAGAAGVAQVREDHAAAVGALVAVGVLEARCARRRGVRTAARNEIGRTGIARRRAALLDRAVDVRNMGVRRGCGRGRQSGRCFLRWTLGERPAWSRSSWLLRLRGHPPRRLVSAIEPRAGA
jgi:hypothetical protein